MEIRKLSEELQKKAEEELNEDAGRISDDITHIRQWIVKQPHLSFRSDDQTLITFLRGCKHSLQQTKIKIDYYCTIRNIVPELFENRDPFLPEIQEILKANVLSPLPSPLGPGGPRIIFFRYGRCNPATMHFFDLMKTYYMILDILLTEDDNSIVSGLATITDTKNYPLGYLKQVTPSMTQKVMLCFQLAYPIRLHSIHIMNVPPVIQTFIELIKKFLSDKLRSRLYLHNEDTSAQMYNSISKSLLPQEYGGDCGSFDEIAAAWKKKIESYRDWFLEDTKYRSNEKLRTGKPRSSADLFGVEGSFRKLNID